MSLPHAILGFLQVMPMTGYVLKTQAFDRTVAYFWPAVQQQIYRELDKLLERGWVSVELEMQHDKPNRKVYSITEAGRAEFAAWLETPQAPPAHREAFLIQLFFAAQLSNAQIVAMLEHQLSIRRHRLDDLRALAASIPPRSPDEVPDRRHLLSWMTLDFGLRLEHTYVVWLTDTIAAVKALPDTAPAVASADV